MKRITVVFLLWLMWVPAFAQDAKDAQANALPLHLGIVLHASKNTFPQQQAAAADLIQRLMHSPDDEAFVITAGGNRPWPNPQLNWDNKPSSLVSFVKGLDKMAGLPDAFAFEVQTTSSTSFREWLTIYKGAPVERSVFSIVSTMMKSDPRPARKVVIMFRDPWDHSPGWGSAYGQYVDRRHEVAIEMLKDAGVAVYVVGIDDPSVRPRVANNMESNYNGMHAGEGAVMRNFDEEFQKAMNVLMAAGRTNIGRITSETGGIVAYGNKKNYTDAVPVIVDKIGSGTSTAAATGK